MMPRWPTASLTWCVCVLTCVGIITFDSCFGQTVVPPTPPVQVAPPAQVPIVEPKEASSEVEGVSLSEKAQTDEVPPPSTQAEPPSSSKVEQLRPIVVIGHTEGQFWMERREARREILTQERLAQRHNNPNEFTVEEALDVIVSIARGRRLSERTPAGWAGPSLLRGRAERLLQIRGTVVPILNEPTLVSDNLVVLALAKHGEFYPLLESVGIPATIGPPLQAKPDMSGTRWARVRTSGDVDGWIYTDGGSTVAAVAYDFPKQATEPGLVHQSDLTATRNEVPSAVFVGAIIVGLFALLVFSMKGRATVSASHSADSSNAGSSSYAPTDYASEAADSGYSSNDSEADQENEEEQAEDGTSNAIVHFRIRVVYYDDGEERPLTHTTVHVKVLQDIGPLGGPYVGRWEDTDGDGVAHFEYDCITGLMTSKELQLKVYVGSVDGDEFTIQDGEEDKEFTVCVDRE